MQAPQKPKRRVFQAALATLFLTPIILTIAKFMSIFMPESSSQWLKQPSRAMDMLLLKKQKMRIQMMQTFLMMRALINDEAEHQERGIHDNNDAHEDAGEGNQAEGVRYQAADPFSTTISI
jgi:hypothetical protein